MNAPAPAWPVDSSTDPLADLRDWALPDAVSWWPPAPGWWLLGLMLCALLAFLAVRGWRAWRRARAARWAERELTRLRADLARDGDAGRFAGAVSILLRRLALVHYPPARVAGLSGAAWIAFLDATGGQGTFGAQLGPALTAWPYQPATASDAAAHADRQAQAETLAQLAAFWIRQHRRGPVGEARR